MRKEGPEDIGVVVEASIENMRELADVLRHHQDEETVLSVTRIGSTDAKGTAAGLDPENAPQLAQGGERMTVTREARAMIEGAQGAEKRGRLGIGLGIGPGDVLVPPRRRAGGRQAHNGDEDERNGSVRRRRKKNERRKR